jgi:hypothetical protein
MDDDSPARVDPFVFVAAVRYAIGRTLTASSELLARQVSIHARLISCEPSAVAAICQEIDDFCASPPRPSMGQTRAEIEMLVDLWQRSAATLNDAMSVAVR